MIIDTPPFAECGYGRRWHRWRMRHFWLLQARAQAKDLNAALDLLNAERKMPSCIYSSAVGTKTIGLLWLSVYIPLRQIWRTLLDSEMRLEDGRIDLTSLAETMWKQGRPSWWLLPASCRDQGSCLFSHFLVKKTYQPNSILHLLLYAVKR